VKKILQYKEILEETAKNNYPHILANYSYELTKIFNTFYNNIPVLNEENQDLKNLRLLLVSEFAKILKESFELLGIEMPEKM
jgi:arginyl-tRNA synthetase